MRRTRSISARKTLSIAITAAMLVSLFVPFAAFAIPTPTASITHAYQIFAADSMEAFDLGGSAAVVGSAVRLTPASASQSGTFFTKQALHLRNKGSFSTAFRFQIDPADGANGFTFVVASDPSSIVPSGLGFTGGGNTMTVEFDTHQDSWDSNDNHVTFRPNGGETYHDPLITYTPTFDMDDGLPKYVWVDYNGNGVYVQISNSPVRTSSPQISCGTSAGYMPTWDANEGDAYFGFTSTTGTESANHDILGWYLDNEYFNYPYLDPGTIGYSTGPATLAAAASGDWIDVSASSDVTFTVTDKAGTPMGNQAIAVTAPLGGTLSAATVTTDANGLATVTYTAPDTRQVATVIGETTGGLRAQVGYIVGDFTPSVTVGTDVTTIPRGSAGVVAPAATVADSDDTTLAAARVRILDKDDGEWLSWLAPAFGIGASSGADGSFYMSGNATLANYETALRNVIYGGSPASSTRQVEFSVFDGLVWSAPVIKTVQIGPMVSPAGADRYKTAIQISQEAFPDGSRAVVIASGEDWPDALCGSTLAGAIGGPVLLTRKGALSPELIAELDRLDPMAAYVLGGEGVVSKNVFDEVSEIVGLKGAVRIGGTDRYQTAELIAAEIFRLSEGETDGTAFVTTGQNYADALSASPIAAYRVWPIFLSGPNGLRPSTVQSMTDYGVSNLILLGGAAAVPAGAEIMVLKKGMSAIRLEGANRFETSAHVAEFGVSEAGLQWDGVVLTTGFNFPDALAGGAAQGHRGSVFLLTDPNTLSADTRAALNANSASIRGIRFLGGTAALSQAVRDAANSCLR